MLDFDEKTIFLLLFCPKVLRRIDIVMLKNVTFIPTPHECVLSRSISLHLSLWLWIQRLGFEDSERETTGSKGIVYVYITQW